MIVDGAVHRGQILGDKYVLGELVGSGGMGLVYAAEQPVLGRTVAIKVVRPELAGEPHVLRRFHTEAIVGSRLSHRNLVAVYDYGATSSGMPFLVMEFVKGLALGLVLAADGPLPVRRAACLVRQILGGLAEAHAAGIVHADVKTDNIIVERVRDGSELVKLLDFGLARVTDEPLTLTTEALLSGTPEYLAPEVILGGAPTPASDVYGAGIILYELLTGTTPFGGGSVSEILARHLEEDVVPPSLRNPDRAIPLAVERVVLRALEKRAEDRYPDAATFAASLDAVTPKVDVPESRRGSEALVRTLFSTEAPTRDLGRDELSPPLVQRRKLAAGSSPQQSREIAELRIGIGTAIQHGDVTEIIAGYLELARALVDERRLEAAVRELEEAVDLLTFGGGLDADEAPESLWRILLTLAALYDGIGDPVRARRAAMAGHDHAVRVHSITGQERAEALLGRLIRGRATAS